MQTFLAEVFDKKGEYTIEEKAESEKDAIGTIKSEGYTITKIVPKRGNHVCKYCYSIAEGADKNLLCEECRMMFGHTFYTEL